ncbi:MAG: purine-nucleoside phosphorylase [Candidatus Omnitrophica bacterium]|nr:purine-nucleoside phosphorylase [Candidatus Omnitrophota bacterium]
MQTNLELHRLETIQETAAVLKKAGAKKGSIGIVLGTGLGSLTRIIRSKCVVPFEDCPHFPRATSVGHAGNVVIGRLEGRDVIAMEGRFHFFEGHTMREITYPVRVMKALGASALFLSNAAGGLDPLFCLGDLMLMTDHINLLGESPLAGPNDDRLGPRFPDMSEPYDPALCAIARRSALDLKIPLKEGVYAAVKGPQLETRAEYRYLRAIGADAVGMSTVPEAIVAAHAGLKTCAFSCITDLCLPDALEKVDITKILATAAKSEPVLTELLARTIRRMP